MSVFSIDTGITTTRISPALRPKESAPSGSTASRTETGDSVSLSTRTAGTSALQGMLSLNALLGFETETPGAVTLEELESHGRQFLDDFNRNVISPQSSRC